MPRPTKISVCVVLFLVTFAFAIYCLLANPLAKQVPESTDKDIVATVNEDEEHAFNTFAFGEMVGDGIIEILSGPKLISNFPESLSKGMECLSVKWVRGDYKALHNGKVMVYSVFKATHQDHKCKFHYANDEDKTPTNTAEIGTKEIAEIFVRETVGTSLMMYRIHVGSYPSTEEGLAVLLTPPKEGSERWRGPYLDKPLEDPWGQPYRYRYPSAHNPKSYDIWSSGPDGVDGTADDICNWPLEEDK